MTRSLTRLQALLLGIVVLLGLGLTAVGVFAVGSRQWLWAETFHLRVGFRQIHGVEIGTRVRVLGRDAGEVEAVVLPAAPSGDVVLDLRLDGRLRPLLRTDASAQIVAEGMVGGKVVEVYPGSDTAAPIDDHAMIAARPSRELTDVLASVDQTLQGVRNGEGSLGKLMKDDAAYQELLKLLQQGRRTMVSINQDAQAIKGMPVVRSYVSDAYQELVRPDCERNRQCFTEAELFEPGHAVLTAEGRKRLDALVPWLEGLKHKGSEVVVAAYARPDLDADLARRLTQKQSETVCDYLTSNYAVQKLGWFSRRKVTALGCGTDPAPLPEKEPLPLPRVEVLVFVPQG